MQSQRFDPDDDRRTAASKVGSYPRDRILPVVRDANPQEVLSVPLTELHHQNYIDGKWCDSESGRRYPIRNPADWREVLHEYPRSTLADMATAIDGAASAYCRWKSVSLAEKSAILRRAVRLIVENRDSIAAAITRENGKLLGESLTEIDSAALEAEFQIGQGERQFGSAGDCFREGLIGYTRKEPLGVVTAIVPWNFPFNVPFRKLVPALMAGNVAILKPAGQTAGVGEIVTRTFVEAGLPRGVLQFVTGSGGELSSSLVAHPRVRAVTFTGSTSVGRQIAELAAKSFTRTQLEMGGKNPVLVLSDADLEAAAEAVVVGAFSCAGQWCTATSRLVVETSIADALIGKVVNRVEALKTGKGNDPTATMGPVCGRKQLDDVLRHIEIAASQGARLLIGGKQAVDGDLRFGCFVQPTVFDCVDRSMSIAHTEIFGPVLSIMRVRNYEEGLELANDISYGLSSSIFTRDLDKALHFAEHSEVGLTHVNVHSAFKDPRFCFGGYKHSGFGLPEAGASGIQFFQDEKAVYIGKQSRSLPPTNDRALATGLRTVPK